MTAAESVLFGDDVWRPALERYAAVTNLTVFLFDRAGRLVGGPFHDNPFFAVFDRRGYDPGTTAECARLCLAQSDQRGPVVVASDYGLGAVGTALVLEGRTVAAAVAGYVLLDFARRSSIERLARLAGVPFPTLWEVARTHQPIPRRRLLLYGDLLQVLGDTILRDNHRMRQYEEAAAAKDEFLAVLSHELRTPLTPILGWARMLKLGEQAQVSKAAEVIERNVLLQVRLVDDLLELTRVTRGKLTLDVSLCDVHEALQIATDAFVDAASQKEVSLHVMGGDEPLYVHADTNRLQQIFRNLFANALKFTPPGGRITVRSARVSGSAVITIRDSGEGIAPEFLPFVFDIFRQQETGTRRTHDGLGIGLALVKGLTEAHGGKVMVASQGLGHGTTVTIQFALVEDAVAARPVERTGITPQTLEGLRVLVVEDMPDSRDATRALLETLGAEVLVAEDGLEALATVERGHPDVVLCDLRMPRMDGFEFLRTLHRQTEGKHPPVIAVSGFSSTADHLRTRTAGFEGHLDKPFDDAGLLAAVGAVVLHHP